MEDKERDNVTNAKNWLYIIIAVICIAGTLAGGVLAWGSVKNGLSVQVEATKNLEEDGCDPAQKTVGRVDLLEYKFDEFEKQQTAIQADTKEILRRLPSQ